MNFRRKDGVWLSETEASIVSEALRELAAIKGRDNLNELSKAIKERLK